MTSEQKKEFSRLAFNLEPEMLYQDGERSRTEAKKVYAKIMKRWKALEKEVGQKVDQSEALHW